MAIIGYIDLEQARRDGMVKEAPLWFHTAGLQQTASGYGGKLAHPLKIRWQGKWRRVYVACYSNSGTAYIEHGTSKDWIVVH